MYGLIEEPEPYMIKAGPEQESALCELAGFGRVRSVFLHVPQLRIWISSIHQPFEDIDYSCFAASEVYVYMGGTYDTAIDHEKYLINELTGDPSVNKEMLQRMLEFNLSFAATFPGPERVKEFLETARQYKDRSLVFNQVMPHGFLSFIATDWPKSTPYMHYVGKVCSFFDEVQHKVLVDEDCDLPRHIGRYVDMFNDASYPYLTLEYRPYKKKGLLSIELN